MMINLRSFGIVLLVASVASVVGCLVKQTKPEPPLWNPGEAYLASTFQGTFTIGRNRVRAFEKAEDEAKMPTALAVANLDKSGKPRWLRAFPGVAKGRAVAFAPVGKNLAVVGVFAGGLNFDRKDQMLMSGADREGLFIAIFDPAGRAVGATLVARAQKLASPDIVVQGDRINVNVPYEGVGDVGGKELPRGTGQVPLRLMLSPEGKLISFEPPRAALDQGPTQGKIVRGAYVDEKPAPGTGLVMASMQSGTCEVCVVDQPRTDPNCANCRAVVCPGDGWCCSTGWDLICMNEAILMCSPIKCTCPHGTCTDGVWMHQNCDPGTPRGQCVGVIAPGDTYCTNTGWDNICSNESRAWCPAPGCH